MITWRAQHASAPPGLLGIPHDLRHDGLHADEFGFKLGFAIFEEEKNDLLQIAIELVERFGLTVGTGKARNVTDVQPGIRIALHDCRESLHERKDTDRSTDVPAALHLDGRRKSPTPELDVRLALQVVGTAGFEPATP
jgi:hypothetical protein